MAEKIQKKVWTKEGFLSMASSLCLIHCLALPLMAGLLPSLGHQFESVFLEYALLVFSIICGAYVMFLGFKRHRKKKSAFGKSCKDFGRIGSLDTKKPKKPAIILLEKHYVLSSCHYIYPHFQYFMPFFLFFQFLPIFYCFLKLIDKG